MKVENPRLPLSGNHPGRVVVRGHGTPRTSETADCQLICSFVGTVSVQKQEQAGLSLRRTNQFSIDLTKKMYGERQIIIYFHAREKGSSALHLTLPPPALLPPHPHTPLAASLSAGNKTSLQLCRQHRPMTPLPPSCFHTGPETLPIRAAGENDSGTGRVPCTRLCFAVNSDICRSAMRRLCTASR